MAQQRVGDPDIALRVLEVDRVHLVRHGRGADLALSQLLGEVAERDIAPGVAVEIEQHAVGARVGVEQLGEPVVRLDLRRVGVELEAQALDEDRKSTRLNSSHITISYAVFCLKKK